jgi:hypothetical protein
MKFACLALLTLILPAAIVEAQTVELNNGVDTSIADYGRVYRLWCDYLHSNPDSVYNNPYWNEFEKRRYRSFDLLNHQGFLSPSLYNFKFDAHVLSISHYNGVYDIRTMFYHTNKEDNKLHVIAIAHVLAKRKERNSNYLITSLI